jgi:hypothetical protein
VSLPIESIARNEEEAMRVRFALVLALIISALTLYAAGPADAYLEQAGDCPAGDSWQLVDLDSIPARVQLVGSALDTNADTCLCIKPLRPGVFVARDNTVHQGQVEHGE